MNILEKRSKFVTNREVCEHLVETSSDLMKPHNRRNYHKINNSIQNYETIAKSLSNYFDKTTCKTQSVDQIKKFVEEVLNPLELEEIEKLQIVNIVPKNMVNLYAIIEECDSRFSEEQCEHLLAKLREFFPGHFIEGEEQAVEEGQAEQVQEDVEMKDS